jgi:hypothetical protein
MRCIPGTGGDALNIIIIDVIPSHLSIEICFSASIFGSNFFKWSPGMRNKTILAIYDDEGSRKNVWVMSVCNTGFSQYGDPRI